MAWFKVDDKFHSHPKVLTVPLRAVGLWVKAGAWSADQLTDGYIPKAVLPILGGTAGDARALVEATLWRPVDGGWQFHDWTDMQPSRTDVETRREQEREKKRRWREKARRDEETGQFQAADLRVIGGES